MATNANAGTAANQKGGENRGTMGMETTVADHLLKDNAFSEPWRSRPKTEFKVRNPQFP